MASDAGEIPEGTLIDGRFEIRRLLGMGGMGAVYRAADTKTGKRVALKILRASATRRDDERTAERRRRLLQEVVMAGRVNHKNIVSVQDFGFFKDSPYIVMELLDGKDLGQVLEEHAGPLSIEHAADIMLAVCSALRACHSVELVHRDLKPGNIMIVGSESGDGWDVKVVDFSISKVTAEGDLTDDGRIVGTAQYLAPEQLVNKAGPASDQYAIGVLLYYCLTKQLPYGEFHGPAVLRAIDRGVFKKPRALRPEIPEKLEEIIVRAMRLSPEARYPSVYELGQGIWSFASPLGRETWKKYYFHQTPSVASAKASTVGVPLIRKILDASPGLDAATALAHYQSTTAVGVPTTSDLGPRDGGTTEPSGPSTSIDPESPKHLRAVASNTTVAPTQLDPSPISTKTMRSGSGLSASSASGASSTGTRAARSRWVGVVALIAFAVLGGTGFGVWWTRFRPAPSSAGESVRGAPSAAPSGAAAPTLAPSAIGAAATASAKPPTAESAPPLAKPPIDTTAPAAAAAPSAAAPSATAAPSPIPLAPSHRASRHHGAGARRQPSEESASEGATAADLLREGDLAFDKGEVAKAAELARKAIDKGGGESAYLLLGDASTNIGNYPAAEKAYKEVLRMNPASQLAKKRLELVHNRQAAPR